MGLPIEPEREDEEAYVAPSSIKQVATAAFEQSRFDNTEVMGLAKRQVFNEQNLMGPKKSAEELNEQFPGHRFDADMTEMAAQTKVTSEEERRFNNQIIQNGNTGFMKGTVLPFASSMGAILADPIGASINFATAGLGRMAIAAKLAKAGTRGKAALNVLKLTTGGLGAVEGAAVSTAAKGAISAANLSTKVKFGIALGDNIASNAMSEAIVFQGTRAEEREYTATQFFNNVVTSSLVFTAATSGLGKLVDTLGGKTMDNTFSMAEKNLEIGNDISKLTDDVLDAAKKDIEIDATFKSAFDSNFPEIKLKEGANIREAFESMYEEVGNGKLSEDAVTSFRSQLDEAGYPAEKMAYSQDEWGAKFDENFIAQQNDRMASPQSNWGHSQDAEKAFKEAADIDATATQKFDADLEKSVEGVKLEDEGFNKLTQAADEQDANFVQALEQFTNCELGA